MSQIIKNITDWEVLTPDGYQDFMGISENESENVIELIFDNGSSFICTDDHKIFTSNNNKESAITLLNKQIISRGGTVRVVSIKPTTHQKTYDLLSVSGGHRFYAGNQEILISNCLCVDEMAHIDDLDAFFESVYPTISSSKKAKMFAISTPNGKNNKFYHLYDDAVKGLNGWHPEKVNWDEVPGRDEKWKELTMRTMGSLKSFRQEYENYFDDDSGESAFSEELFKLLKDSVKDPVQVIESPKDHLDIWEPPVSGHIYSIGVDVAEGIGKNASTADVLDITDIKNIRQVASYWTNQIEPKHFAVKVLEIARKWGSPPLCIERNNHGGQVIDVLWDRYQYPNIVTYIPNAGDASQRFAERKGIMSHTNSKYHAVMNMRYYISEKRFVQINNINTINEYENFKRRANGTWGANDDELDDRVISIMWALMILEPHVTKDYFEIVELDAQGKPTKLIPNFDTYIRSSDIVIPRRNYNRNTNNDYSRYDFMPTLIGSSNNSVYDDLSMQGWEPLQQ